MELRTASTSQVSPSASRSSVWGATLTKREAPAGQVLRALQGPADAEGVELVHPAGALRDVERLRGTVEAVLARDAGERLDGEEVAGAQVPDRLVVTGQVALGQDDVQGGGAIGRDGDELTGRIDDGGCAGGAGRRRARR